METQKINDIVKVGDNNCKIILDSKTLHNEINKIAKHIHDDYIDSEPPVLIFVTNGAVYFGVNLSTSLQKINLAHMVDSVRIKRYSGDGLTNDGIKIIGEPQIDISGKDVIVIEDVIDEGVTLNFLNKYLKNKSPKSIEYCVLIEKSGHVPLDFEVKYKILDNFGSGWLIGFGMDSEQLFRGLDYICIKV